MPIKAPPGRNLEAPSPEEITAAHQTRFSAAIGVNAGAPSDALLARLTDFYGAPMAADQLFVFPAQLSNSLVDFYWTYMPKPTLDQYGQDATAGRALMIAHNYMDMPCGYSYQGTVEEDVADPTDARPVTEDPAPPPSASGTNSARRRTQAPAPTDPVWRLFVQWYIVREGRFAAFENAQVIRAIETRTWRDMSIGFHCDVMRCDLCHMDLMSWDCPHMPGAKYETEAGVLERCIAAVEGGQMLEGSFGYKGATPDAAVVPVKARLLAATRRLTRDEAQIVTALETRLGERLIDLRHIQRAYATTHLVPAIPRTTGKETNMAKTVTKPGQRVTGKRAEGDPPADSTVDAGVVADLATLNVDQLTAELARIDGEIVRVQSEIDALQALMDAPPAEVDGVPVDNTEQAALWQTQMDNLQTEMQALLDEQTATQALLDEANGIAQAAGGTPADAPASSGGGSEGQMTQAAAALRQMLNMAHRYVSPALYPRVRALTSEEAQPIIDLANQLITALNGLVEASGEEPARTVRDMAVMAALRQVVGSTNNGRVGVAMVRNLKLDAEAGREYRKALIDQAVAEQTRVLGVERVDPEQYRSMLRDKPVEVLQAEISRYGGTTPFTPGRSVIPESMMTRGGGGTQKATPTVQGREDEADTTLAGRAARAQHPQAPTPVKPGRNGNTNKK